SSKKDGIIDQNTVFAFGAGTSRSRDQCHFPTIAVKAYCNLLMGSTCTRLLGLPKCQRRESSPEDIWRGNAVAPSVSSPEEWQTMHLADGGPKSRETDLSRDRWIVEPWNAATASLFILISLFWAWKLRGRYRQFLFLSLCLLILGVGGIGGTLYHGFRSS